MATWYISPTGSNANNGTSKATAWADLHYALNKPALASGDTIICCDGVYNVTANIDMGSLGCTMNLTAYAMIWRDGGHYEGATALAGGSYVRVVSETKHGAKFYGGQVYGTESGIGIFVDRYAGASWIWFDGLEIYGFRYSIDRSGVGGDHVKWTNCKVHDTGRVGVIWSPSVNCGAGAYGIQAEGQSYYYFINNIMYNIGRLPDRSDKFNLDHTFYLGNTASNPSHHIYIIGNTMWNSTGNPLEVYTKNTYIYNNVCAWPAEVNGASSYLIGINQSDGVTESHCNNNIFFQPSRNTAGTGQPLACLIYPLNCSNWQFKNNACWFDVGVAFPMFYTYGGLPGTITGNYGTHAGQNAPVDPKFVNVNKATHQNNDGANWHLQAISPLRGMGCGLPSEIAALWPTDIDGNPVNAAMPDIGAYQYVAGGTTYYNVEKSGLFTKNDCGVGYYGSTVVYTVPAGKYSSTTSQALADNFAQQDINNNGQAYANAHGSCILLKSGNFGGKNHDIYIIPYAGGRWQTIGGVLTKIDD